MAKMVQNILDFSSEYFTLTGYIVGNTGFLKAEILLHVLISY